MKIYWGVVRVWYVSTTCKSNIVMWMEIEKSKVLIQFLLIFRQSGDVLFFLYARRLRGYTATIVLNFFSGVVFFLLLQPVVLELELNFLSRNFLFFTSYWSSLSFFFSREFLASLSNLFWAFNPDNFQWSSNEISIQQSFSTITSKMLWFYSQNSQNTVD